MPLTPAMTEALPPAAPAQPVDLLIVGAGFGGLYMLHTARH